MKRYDFVVIGNSAGGIGCIETLRNLDPDASIAVISDEKYHTYSRALIPYYLDGKIEFDKMYYRPLDFYERMKVEALLGKRATRIDFKNKVVELDDGESVGYGKLLLATGGRPFIPPIEGINRKKVFTFVKMDDVIGIKESLQSAENAVVLGGGVIGLMVAEVLKRKGLEVTVVELADRVLAPVVDKTTSKLVEDIFRENGVKIITNNTIKKVIGEEGVEGVILNDGTEIPAHILIVGIGVMPRIELVKDTDVETNRGIVVNNRMETSVKDVYACGDCSEVNDFLFNARRPLPLWPVAYTGGRIAAYNMCGIDREYTHATSMNAMHFFDLYIINAGLNVADEEEGYEIIKKFDEERRIYRRFVLRDGKIVGMILVGEVERAGVILNLMRREVDVTSFKDKLLNGNFGYADIPDDLRWRLLCNDVILGVVREQ
ncbi:MAG TPA: NAD(P)/FAD-dependent oxidoreductase [Archaeoglobaceae archaeon]|nr:NAD(P)/FAD-dependent oxidoreductase [Archaeoglobaceae archaeon]